MKFTEWQTKRLIELNYQRSLHALMNNFFKKMPHMKATTPNDILREFKDYCQNRNFSAYVHAAASRMATGLLVDSARTWRRAASEGMQGRRVYEMLKHELRGPVGVKVREIVSHNAMLISSLPEDVAKDVNAFIMQEAEKGARAKEIHAGLKLMPSIQSIQERVQELTETRIALITRTETSKASTALTRSRSDELGLDWYIWRTSKDARVRESHQHMDRVMISWSDAPNPERIAGIKSTLGSYHAGDAPNDRCYPQPVISLNRVDWPVKVHISGTIERMTRADFERRFNPLRRAA